MEIGWVELLIGSVGTTILYTLTFGSWKGRLDEKMKNIDETLKEFRKDISDKIENLIDKINDHEKRIFGIECLLKNNRVKLAKGKSPLGLTDLGEDASKHIKADDLAEKIASSIKNHNKICSMNNYDIQEFCFNYISTEYEPPSDLMDTIKDFAYMNSIHYNEVMIVLQIKLRDYFIKKKENNNE